TSCSRLAALKPFAIRLLSGVELSWIAPYAQWWLVTTRPSGETKLAVQPPNETTALIGGLVRSARSFGSPLKPAASSCAAISGSCEGIHMPSSAWAPSESPAIDTSSALRSAMVVAPLRSVMWQSHFLEQALGVVDFVHRPAHVARVDVDRARQRGIEDPVRAQAFVVAVEQQADQLALRVERGRTGVAAGGVHVAEEVDRHVAQVRHAVLRALAAGDGVQLRLRRDEGFLAGGLGDDAGERGER